jgi:hypothetical protein
MQFNIDKVRANVRSATTDDLLDRATVWRDATEPEALDVIEAELRQRGVRLEEIEIHAERRARAVIAGKDGAAAVCYRCARPAIGRRWVWGRLWKVLPLFPRRAFVCEEHGAAPGATSASQPDPRPPA